MITERSILKPDQFELEQKTEQIPQLGDTIFFGAHPDDLEFTIGGIVAAQQQSFSLVLASPGQAGSADSNRYPLTTIDEVRTREQCIARDILGIQNLAILQHQDGHIQNADPDMLLSQFRAYIRQTQPDTIITFGPDGLTGHEDHIAVGNVVEKAFDQEAKYGAQLYYVAAPTVWAQHDVQQTLHDLQFINGTPIVFYPPVNTDITVRLSEKEYQTKIASLRTHDSQYGPMFERYKYRPDKIKAFAQYERLRLVKQQN